MYVFFAGLHPFHSKDGTYYLSKINILDIKANSHSCLHLLLKIHKSGQNYYSVIALLYHPTYYFLVNFSSFVAKVKSRILDTVRPQHSALPLILFAFIHDFASLTQFTHSFHFHAYLMSRSPIYLKKIISRKLNQMSQLIKNIFSNNYFEFIIKNKIF